jgi:hypothetical protein
MHCVVRESRVKRVNGASWTKNRQDKALVGERTMSGDGFVSSATKRPKLLSLEMEIVRSQRAIRMGQLAMMADLCLKFLSAISLMTSDDREGLLSRFIFYV